MTRYALDEQRGAILAVWATGDGDTAATVATLPPSAPVSAGYAVVAALTGLSAALWRTYTHTAASAGDDMEDNSEGWRRQGERDAFAAVLPALAKPHLPSDDGMIMQSYVAVEEGAHRVGRALHAIGDEHLSQAVAAEVGAEIAAVEQAELGELSGRARQAVVLTRADVSPVQVAEANRLLTENPFGPDALFTTIDPTAAAVAAAHWLHAAATVAAGAAGQSVTGAVVEADDVMALPVDTLATVLEMIEEDGASPHEAVIELIRDAMAVAEGEVPDPLGLTVHLSEAIADLKREAERLAPGDQAKAALSAMLSDIRITPLDPARPALDLLEDLLVGIEGCAELFAEYADYSGSDDEDDEISGDERADARGAAIRSEFLAAVREVATAGADRLQ